MNPRRALTKRQVREMSARIAAGMSKAQAAREYSVSVRTVYRMLDEQEIDYRVKIKPCGTNAAYMRHLRKGERPCPPCSDAHAKTNRDWNNGVTDDD